MSSPYAMSTSGPYYPTHSSYDVEMTYYRSKSRLDWRALERAQAS